MSSRHHSYEDSRLCGPGQTFTDIDGINGECRCSDPYQAVWKKNGKCRTIHVQVLIILMLFKLIFLKFKSLKGPCRDGEWLYPDSGKATCQPSPCPDKADGLHIYWDKSGRPGCYRSYSRGPCPRGTQFIIKDYQKPEADCQPVSDYNDVAYPARPPAQARRQYPYYPANRRAPSYYPSASYYQRAPRHQSNYYRRQRYNN